jgi:hypothetical protein
MKGVIGRFNRNKWFVAALVMITIADYVSLKVNECRMWLVLDLILINDL